MKILLIDDDKKDRDLIITYIKKIEKYKEIKTDECCCLNDGIKKLDQFCYDAILLDLILPETEGIETIKAIFKHLKKINKNIPIIVLTGMEDYSIGRKAWELGVKDYLIKDEIHTLDISRALTFAIKKRDSHTIHIESLNTRY